MKLLLLLALAATVSGLPVRDSERHEMRGRPFNRHMSRPQLPRGALETRCELVNIYFLLERKVDMSFMLLQFFWERRLTPWSCVNPTSKTSVWRRLSWNSQSRIDRRMAFQSLANESLDYQSLEPQSLEPQSMEPHALAFASLASPSSPSRSSSRVW